MSGGVLLYGDERERLAHLIVGMDVRILLVVVGQTRLYGDVRKAGLLVKKHKRVD